MKTANKFLKEMQKVFGDVEYRATSNEGIVFKSKGWDNKYGKENDSKRSEFPRVYGYGQKRN
jgi:hypothetical protein